MFISTFLELLAVALLIIGFINEKKIVKLEHRFIRWLMED